MIRTPRLARAAILAAAALSSVIIAATAAPGRRPDSCDALTARMIRATGASLAGRAGAMAVFRAADAERMSLDCRAPRRMVFGSLDSAPDAAYFRLIGRAAQALTGADPVAAEALALSLQQDSRLTAAPRQGAAGRVAIRCEIKGGLAGDLSICALAPSRPPALRRRAGLFAAGEAG